MVLSDASAWEAFAFSFFFAEIHRPRGLSLADQIFDELNNTSFCETNIAGTSQRVQIRDQFCDVCYGSLQVVLLVYQSYGFVA